MDTNVVQKQENHRSHLRLVSIERTPEQLLDLEFAEAIVALEVEQGTERPRRFYKIAAGELHPTRVLARLVHDALCARVHPMALFRALMMPLQRLIERKYRRRLTRPESRLSLPGGRPQ